MNCYSSDIKYGSGKLSSLTKVKGGQRAVWCSHYGMDSSTTPPQLNDIVHALKIDLCTHVIVAVYYAFKYSFLRVNLEQKQLDAKGRKFLADYRRQKDNATVSESTIRKVFPLLTVCDMQHSELSIL